ncbi:MAG: hypothetical protein U9Q83_09985, partial [Bacteroidota bacterium]|nr:hypothetical protein [Bacteroidota bacterium]
MKKYLINLFFIIISFGILKAESPRKPFVVLRINGSEYKAGETINVRPGERISVVAVLLGGRRDYCSNPQKYANIGKTTVITNQGEDGMSFYIGDGTFRGSWSLVTEIASFSGGTGVIITSPNSNSNSQKQNSAVIEIPQSGFGQVYVKIKITTKWHYIRNTQAGKSEKNETNDGSETFYFKIQSEEGVWYSSANLTAKGVENFSVRNSLDAVQKSYDDIYNQLVAKNFSNISMYVNNLKSNISSLKSSIDREKSADSEFECEVTFIGLPTSLTMKHISSLETLGTKWKELFLISQENVTKINDMLLKVRTGLSSNVLKSVFKNYINWGTSIPTGAVDFMTLYDPSSVLAATALPGKVMGWWQDANSDASILNNQFETIKMLSSLQRFYMDRMTNSVDERKEIQVLLDELKPVKKIHQDLKNYFATISWASVKN